MPAAVLTGPTVPGASLAIAPAPTAPVPAAAEGTTLFPLLSIPRKTLMKGITVTLANHGVAQTLKISRTGRSAFVIAYAVANLSHKPSGQPFVMLS